MLKIAESHIKKDKAPVLLMGKTSKKKPGMKGSKRKLNPKGGVMKRKKEKKASEKDTCFHYSKVGHWKRNCKVYLASVKTGASNAPKSIYEMHTILSLSSPNSDS